MKIRQFWVLFTFFAIIILSVSCSRKPDWDDLNSKIVKKQKETQQLMNLPQRNERLRKETKELVKLYEKAYEHYPLKENIAEYLYQAAKLYSHPLQEYSKTISILKTINSEYSEAQVAEQALFLLGYTYSEKLSEYEKAREAYKSFMEKYPNSALIPSVRFEIKNLGQPEPIPDFLKKDQNF